MQITSLRGARKGTTYELDTERIRVGKADDNDVVIPDDTVSRHHFEIQRDIRGFLVRDLGSTNGTRVDGAVIREAYMRPGAIVTAGQAKIRFRLVEKTPALSPAKEPTLGPLAARATVTRKLLAAIEPISELHLPVTVAGEVGTGKRTVCRAIHQTSVLGDGPLVMSDESLQREGIDRAEDADPAGLVSEAQGGTLVVVEPWSLSARAQARLCKALERERNDVRQAERQARPFRLLATTTRDLSEEARQGRLDSSLAGYLLSARLRIPPLRERLEDGELFLERLFSAEIGKGEANQDPTGFLTPFLIDLVWNHGWPGNVAELEEFGRAWLKANRRIRGEGIRGEGSTLLGSFEENVSFRANKRRWVDRFEKSYLSWLISRCGGNVSQAAREAAMDRKHLNNLLRKHGLKR